MLVLAVLGVALVSSLLTGGRLEYARNWQLKGLWMALGAFAVQTALFTQWGTGFVGEALVPVVYVVTLSALVVFLVVNRRVLGVPILLAGLMLNMLVISANAGRMPASVAALTGAGRVEEADLLRLRGAAANCILMSDFTRLNMLGDNIVIRLGGPVGSAYSVGDLVALAGEAVVVFGVLRAKPAGHQSEERV
ncbi:DUF5317 family protein [Candidatus Cryosericum terrychapinii]|uniref:DUF5317 domain-containing protein n=1 Tax=Candidatus Cryosericum terrychapinii TaxID=2290919 RepID=A0A398CTQ2_9BACT|nr:DUF5317 family protein [Candidatus Cryosericum terrychapinii]RIE05933.1 hypothetical protein SMC7_04705 [Candidatus Cryosericum terrychapinii]